MATLQDKINDITKEHNFKIFADKISNGIKHQAILSIYGDFISFDCKTLEEAKYLLVVNCFHFSVSLGYKTTSELNNTQNDWL